MVKKSILLLIISISFLFSACKFFQNSVIEYCEYWTGTVQVGQEEILTPHKIINDIENISAENGILEINLYIINPKNYELLQSTNSSQNFFSIKDPINNKQISTESSFTSNNTIIINAELDENDQGKTFLISGFLSPENTVSMDIESLKKNMPELFYEKTFILNTPPDSILNYKLSEDTKTFDNKNLHYLIFKIPDQTKPKNCNVSYKISTFDKDFNKIDEEIVTNNLNTQNDGNFHYYSKKQKENLEYNYTITVIGELKLTSPTFSTDPVLGNAGISEPTITINNSTKETSENDTEIYTIIEPLIESTTLKITKEENIQYKIKLDDTEQNSDSFTISIGEHKLSMTLSKDKCETTTYTKTIKIQGSLPDPTITINNATYSSDSVYSEYKTWDKQINSSASVNIQNSINSPYNSSTTVIKDGQTINSNNLPLGKIELSTTIEKTNYKTKVYKEKIYLRGILPTPSILFKDNSNTTSATKDQETVYQGYNTYTAFVDYEGKTILNVYNGMVDNKIKNTIILDNQPYNSKPISYGKHTVKITTELENHKTNIYEESFYLRGTLHTPELTSSNGEFKGFDTSTNPIYLKYQFSYLQDDYLKIKINYVDTDINIITKENGTQKSSNVFSLKPDEKHTIETTVSKANYKTLTTTFHIKPIIKPIKLSFNTDNNLLRIQCSGFDYPNSRSDDKGLRGTIKLFTNNVNEIIWSYEGSNFNLGNNWNGQIQNLTDSDKREVSYTVNNTTETIYLYFSDIRRYNSAGSNHPDFDFKINGSKQFNNTTNLKIIKSADPTDGGYGCFNDYKWVYVTDLINSDKGWTIRLYVHLTATEVNE